MLTVIIPAYNEEAMLEKTASVITTILNDASIPHELIFIDDGSKDKTWDKILSATDNYPTIRGLHFSRNFGKESAIVAGLTESRGNCCVVIDCDLQHPPEKIVEMYHLWEQGYEIVEGQKSSRGNESKLHEFAANTFYSLISKATGIDMANASDFKLLDRKAVDVLVNMRERNAFFRALSSWIGFKTTVVEFDVREREAGETKWSTAALTKYAINNISSFSAAPMQIITGIGVVSFITSLVIGLVSLVILCNGQYVSGFLGLLILQLFIGGVIMIGMGIVGYYIAKVYDEIKARPRYIISKKSNFEDNNA